MMKRRIACLLAVIICMAAALPAYAVENGFIFPREELISGDWIRTYCAVGDVIWACGERGVYSYDTLTGEKAEYVWTEDVRAAQNWATLADGSMAASQISGILEWDGMLYVLQCNYRGNRNMMAVEDMVLGRIITENDEASIEAVEKLDVSPLLDEDGYLYLGAAIMVGGRLCVLTSSFPTQVAVYETGGSGKAEIVDEDLFSRYYGADIMFEYNGKAVVSLYSFDEESGEACSVLMTIDPETRQCEELATIPGNTFGMTADPETGRILYIKDSELRAMNIEDGSDEKLLSMPYDIVGNAPAFCTQSGAYVIDEFSTCSLIVRDVRADRKDAVRLVIATDYRSEAISQAVIGYDGSHPDVEIVFEGTDNVLSQLMTRSSDVDIFELESYGGSVDLKSVLERGWALELDSEALQTYTAQMYPDLQTLCMKNGKAVAVPLCGTNSCIGIGFGAMKAMGLTMDDIPANWPDFLNFLSGLDADTSYPLMENYGSVEQTRRNLLNAMLEDYIVEVQQGTVNGFDTPELRTMLAAFEQLDFEKLTGNNFEDGQYLMPLINLYSEGTVNGNVYDNAYGVYPLPLSIDDQHSVRMALDCVVAIVNPASEHIKEATEFLETAAASVRPGYYATFTPSVSEPVLNETEYQRTVSRIQADIADREALLATLDKESGEYQAEQETIEAMYESITDIENLFWEISPDSLAWYRDHDESVVMKFSPNGGSIFSMTKNYLDGNQTADELIGELEHQYAMELRENQ